MSCVLGGRRGLSLLLTLCLLACATGCGRRRGGGDDDDVAGDGDADADGGNDGCPEGWKRCDGSCVYILGSASNCGDCGISCGGLECVDGQCGSDCGDLASCPSGCADTSIDRNNCGGCDIVCGEGQNCLIGECRGGTGTGDVRLVGGASVREGRVEILHDGVWGTICDDNWDAADAQVACRQLGYHGGTPCSTACFGQGAGTIWMDGINCTGMEASLDLCSFNGWGSNDCQHTEDSGVTCDP